MLFFILVKKTEILLVLIEYKFITLHYNLIIRKFFCRNALCGKLMCYNGTSQPSSGNFFANWNLQNGGKCYVIRASLTSDMVDPFLVRMGIKCGNEQVTYTRLAKNKRFRRG